MQNKFTLKFLTLCFFVFQSIWNIHGQTSGCQTSKNAQTQSIYYSSENLRSDTFNVLKYTINLEIGNTGSPQLAGNTQIRFAPKLNNRTFIRFDLLKLVLDSVKENTQLLTYTYNDTILKVNFTTPKNTTDTSIFTVYYHGIPQIDGTGWGGFYFDNAQNAQYAYNLGVGFGAKPHNYGRVWFPCFDNFVERSKYEFNITSDSTRRAYCNGQLMSDFVTANKRTRKWVLNEEVPTYIVNVALANYTQVNWTVNTLTGIKPITLVGVASDTTAMKTGFANLKNCITGFENYFGPYKWNRFGYCLVPFNSGAMEHATNISYPRAFIGNLTYEADLMAHELSHHWWGDLITCETQEDMWINEGMATFSSYMFTEWQYGKTAYINKVKAVHEDLLHFLHKNEGGFRAISGVPHSLTYGTHVYSKGADVAHTLRGYMGDSAFFAGAKYTMQQNAFKSINSNEFRDHLQTSSGQNLIDFFNNWVFSGGWSHFAIDSVRYIQNGTNTDAVVSLKQKLYGASTLHSSVPLELSFFKSDWSRIVKKVVISGATQTFTLANVGTAVYCALNYDDKISDATSHEAKIIKVNGNVSYTLGKLFLQVQNAGADSSLVRVIHNYVKPDPFIYNPIQHKLSDQHFWKVEGILSNGFVSKARFNYDGNKTNSGIYGYLDTLLTTVNGDSINLFYRQNAANNWRLVTNVTKFSSGLKNGYIQIDTLKIGEYAFGNYGDSTLVGVNLSSKSKVGIKVYPNPATQTCVIDFKETPKQEYELTVFDIEGKEVIHKNVNAKKTQLDISNLAKGAYLLKFTNEGKTVSSQKLLVE
ncbi:M1 family aminopeptidase [Aurantibacillus circumpalustris]|uniref:M1 family aminopeptidase n=1 Tax=Aurantibacillus circumpalustris TaxID=3036359 RepID=UPI00295BBB5D|nr:M1 family aminopeptidase [Aurantibacillus circumpalustris]